MDERDALTRAKEPLTPLSGPYGHPIHPMLVPVPIGAWVTSFGLDLLNQLLPDQAVLANASALMLGAGVLGAGAAAIFGFLDLLALRAGTRVFRLAITHMSINLLVTAAFAFSLWLRWSGGVSSPTPAVPLAVSGLAIVGLAVSGWLGGQLAYRYGVRVAAEERQWEGYR